MRHITAACALLASSLLASVSAHAADTYNFDASHTNIYWHISHFGFSNPGGKFADVTGTLTLDEAAPQNSAVNVTIGIASLATGIPKLDEHLKSDMFLNLAKFPQATFVSDKVEVTGSGTAKLHGMLTLLGVSKPETLDVKLNKIGDNPINKKKTAGFSATTTIKRSDFGMTAYLPGLGDEVRIEIEAEANQ